MSQRSFYGAPFYPMVPIRSGEHLLPSPSGAAGGPMALTLNLVYAFPVINPVAFTADLMSLYLATSEASSVVRVGVYSNNVDAPGSLIVDAGTIDTSSGTTVVKNSGAISAAIPAGLIWVCAVAQVASSALRVYNYASATLRISSTNTAYTFQNYPTCRTQSSVTGALDASWGGTTGVSLTNVPIVGIRRA